MSYFSRRSFAFLKELKENNEREWFQDNKARYEAELKEPAQQFIIAVGEKLSQVSPHLKADPRGNGGSLFRIYRDVRFSHDKSPYKTHAGVHFRHMQAKDAYAPGIYLHVEPGGCFLGAGVWHPPAPALRLIRERITEKPAEWREAIGSRKFKATFELAGDSLTRAPRGFDPAHPLAEDVRRKDFICVTSLTQKQVTANDLVDQVIDYGQTAKPLLKFICEALSVPF